MRYRPGAHHGDGVGPESRKHCGGGERQPHRRVVQNSWITERWGRRSGCKTKHCCGLGGRARCRHRKVVQNLYTTTWQSNIVGPFTPPPPQETRNPGRRGWWAVSRVRMWVFFYLKWRWALNQEITGSAAHQGWCPRSAACNS